MPGDIQFHSKDSYFGKNLTSTVEKNEVPESRVHDMALRILAAWFLHEQDQVRIAKIAKSHESANTNILHF
jgi:hypothetical protein